MILVILAWAGMVLGLVWEAAVIILETVVSVASGLWEVKGK